tara:strand:+ start:363 stop:974 length:612 start_codon:yes stop_codon:yes gene_type:complete
MALNFCNNNSLSAITSIPAAISGGALNLISTQTASSSATISFTSGIDSTYKEYIFKFYNIHPATDEAHLTFQVSTDGGSNYNTTLTSSYILVYHAEDDSETSLNYQASHDQAQTTNFQNILHGTGNADDEAGSGTLHLFDPSNTTFVKHFTHRASTYNASGSGYNYQNFAAGYFNTTSAVNAVQFKMSSGNIDAGVIKLYGVS